MIGVLLVLLTWAVILLALVAMGYGVISVGTEKQPWWISIRESLWWGLAIAILSILAINLKWPMRSSAAAIAMGVVLLLLALLSGYSVVRGRAEPTEVGKKAPRVVLALILALGVAIVFFAIAALGPVTNYDSGLYHLGAVMYSGDYSTIPGLANLYFPFGYNNSLFPTAAFLGNGPWAGEGFRLINGLLIVMMLFDLGIRWLRGARTVGAYVLLVATVITLVPMVALSDYWVTSPTADSSLLILTMVCIAYMADAAWTPIRRGRNGATAFIIGVVCVSMRPLMFVFLIGIVVVLGVLYLRTRTNRTRPASYAILAAAGIIATLFLVVQSARDYVLSGWLQFPLSLHTFSVAWLSVDPVTNRAATLGNARDPENLWAAASGWQWIPAWLARLPTQWETYLFVVIAISAIVMLVLTRRRTPIRARSLALLLIPSTATCVVWFLASPPAYRFIWGPLFALAVLPLGWALHLQSRLVKRQLRRIDFAATALIIAAVSILVVIGYTFVARIDLARDAEPHTWALGPVSVQINLAPIEVAQTTVQRLSTGLSVRMPVDSDQCWDVYPLCTAQLAPTVGMRSESIQDGFLP